jgi:acetyl esterase/lipase
MTLNPSLTLGAALVFSAVEAASAQAAQDPPFRLPENVEMKMDVVYGKGGGRDLKLDLFLPKEGGGARPAVLFIHGGGWQGGTRTQFHRQAAYLASVRGYVGACIEYRLSGEARFPAAVEDNKCAVRWLRASAGTYRIDPERIAAAGGSAGGHLAAMLGLTSKVAGLEGSGGHAGFSSRVNAVVDFNGASDLAALAGSDRATGPVSRFLGVSHEVDPELYRRASPITHVARGAPPFLFLHGTDDTTIPIDQSRAMVQKLRDAGVMAEIYEAPGAAHGFFNRPPHYEPTLREMEAFLVEQF